jgi:hypothetical protein
MHPERNDQQLEHAANLSMSSRMGMGPWFRLKKRSTGVMYDAARSRRAGSALNGSCVTATWSVSQSTGTRVLEEESTGLGSEEN